MDQTTLVGRLGGRVNQLIDDLFAAGVEVLAAAWVPTSEYVPPFLYLVSPSADAGRVDDTYRIIQGSIRAGGQRWIPLYEIKLIPPSDRLARGLLDIARRIPTDDRSPITQDGTDLGGVPIFGPAYIYPVPQPAPAPGS